MKYNFVIGIDTGVNCGFAVYDCTARKVIVVETLMIHEALFKIENLPHKLIKVRIEDARLRKWVQGGREKLQGVGSVKRDAKIFEDYCKDRGIAYELVAPKNNKTKVAPEMFKILTGWSGRCSVHARDAAMLCVGVYQ